MSVEVRPWLERTLDPRRTSEVDIKETRRITALTRGKCISGTSDRSEGRTRDKADEPRPRTCLIRLGAHNYGKLL